MDIFTRIPKLDIEDVTESIPDNYSWKICFAIFISFVAIGILYFNYNRIQEKLILWKEKQTTTINDWIANMYLDKGVLRNRLFHNFL